MRRIRPRAGVMDDESFHTVFTENPKRWLIA
jgi:hypothetical protein